MSKEKQIEKMAKVIARRSVDFRNPNVAFMTTATKTAETLYNAGYRKQSEGEWVYHECVSSYDGIISGYSCSECCIFVNEEMFDSDEFHKDFCGHCGAHMKGGTE